MSNVAITVFKGLKTFAVKNSPAILTAFAVGGLGTTIFMAIRGSKEAEMLISEEKEHRMNNAKTKAYIPFTLKEEITLTWKCYIPAAVAGAATVACILGAQTINARRKAALAGAYALSETALREYQDKVKETFGEKKAQTIKDEVAKDRLNKAGDSQVIIMAGSESLCFDAPSGRYFKSDIETLRRIRNDLNERMFSEMFISTNDIYDAINQTGTPLGLDHLSIGDGIGFDINHNGLIEFTYSCQLTKNGVPCLVLDYMPRPKWDAID